MKQQLVDSNAKRLAAIEAGEQIVVGVNAWTASENSPLFAQGNEGVVTKVQGSEAGQVERLQQWRMSRDEDRVAAALADLRNAAQNSENIMPPSIAAAKAGVTTGEWGQVLRDVYREFRAPTGIGAQVSSSDNNEVNQVRQAVEKLSQKRGRKLKILVGKPGLDGHSNGAEQIAVRARDCGLDVVYDGIRFTPTDIVNSAVEEKVDVVGLSILSGSHLSLVSEIIEGMNKAGLEDIPVVVGGIIPPEDAFNLKSKGVAAIYTPKDFQLTEIMGDIVRLVEAG
jgi:(2R)-ethylmalonyl-CoA mutase